MANSWQGQAPSGTVISVIVEGDGSATTVAIALASACLYPYFTQGTNGALPTQLAEASGVAIFGTKSISYTSALSAGTVTLTFSSAPPSGIYSNPIAIGFKFP